MGKSKNYEEGFLGRTDLLGNCLMVVLAAGMPGAGGHMLMSVADMKLALHKRAPFTAYRGIGISLREMEAGSFSGEFHYGIHAGARKGEGPL